MSSHSIGTRPSEVVSPTLDGQIAEFLAMAIRTYGTQGPVLDFGCGDGRLVREFGALGWNAVGCDFEADGELLSPIQRDPYRLPYEDAAFAAVVSVSVLEHAQNTRECYQEIWRVLRPGGVALHLFPSKWYLPFEPHIDVPLVSWMWPKVPRWWLALFARLGIRNEFQVGLPWREVVSLNANYIRDGLCYRSNSVHERLSHHVFGNAEWPVRFAVDHAPGRSARLLRIVRAGRFGGAVSNEVRTAFLLQRKAGAN